MKTIYTSTDHLKMKGPNQSFGNHLQHVFFVYNVSDKLNINLAISCDSNLDNLFELDDLKKLYTKDIHCLFNEEWGGTVDEYISKERKNLNFYLKLLNNEINLPLNFYLNGWFYHQSIMPSEKMFEKIKIKESIKNYVIQKYGGIFTDENCFIHYRGTDFSNHSLNWGDLRLPMKYYIDSIKYFKVKKNIKNFIIISDEPDFFYKKIKEKEPDINLEIISEIYYIDWYLLFKSKNLISSNSSFSWTAGLFNKENIVQPKGYLTHNFEKNKVFPPDVYYKNSFII